jgi:Flp pilus assembly protein TadG
MGAIAVNRGLHALRRFGVDRQGVSAVEFALVLPFMLTLYLGSFDLGNGLAVQYRATNAARTVADLASQYIKIDTTTMNQVLGAAAKIMAPYSANTMIVVVSEVTTTNASGAAAVTWSAASNGATARTVGSSVTLPDALHTLPTGTSLILGEVTYSFTPQFSYVFTSTINVYQSQYFYPRQGDCVDYNGVCTPPSS